MQSKNLLISAAGKWVFALLFLLILIGLLYVLTTAQLTGDPSAPGQTPLGEAALSFVHRTLQVSAATRAFPLLALGAAFLLGGLHTLTPGHNKTLTGAYLVGAHGRLRHAVLIGSATAFSHTASAIVIGTLALSTAGQFFSVQYLRWIGLPSGILAVILGIWLLRKYFGARGEHSHDYGHDHEHGHSHPHDHSHDHSAPDRMTLGGLVALGLMHGIVPTIDALAILLVALNVEQVILGIGLILAYSFGIATVLIAVGTLFIQTQNLLLESPRFSVLSRWSPLLAAITVILLGLVVVVRTLVSL